MAAKKTVTSIIYSLAEELEKTCIELGINPRDTMQVEDLIKGLNIPRQLTTVIVEQLDKE